MERSILVISRVILDAGAVIALTRGDSKVRALLTQAVRDRTEIVVSPVVIVQTIRGGAADVAIYRLLKAAETPAVDASLGIEARRLLGNSGLSDAVDALVAVQAVRRRPSVILTSDPKDMELLVGTYRDIRIVTI